MDAFRLLEISIHSMYDGFVELMNCTLKKTPKQEQRFSDCIVKPTNRRAELEQEMRDATAYNTLLMKRLEVERERRIKVEDALRDRKKQDDQPAINSMMVVKAGFCNDTEPQPLRFVHEPEAAGIFCTHLDMSRYDSLQAGERVLVVDCGGGTVDVSVLEKEGPDKFKKLAVPSGGPWGGNSVSDTIWQFNVQEIELKSFLEPLPRLDAEMKYEQLKLKIESEAVL